jgi:hypothetical protein
MKQKLYYGRPVNIKSFPELDKPLLQKVVDAFPDWEIEDSGLKKHGDGYLRFKKEFGNGMEYYFQEVLPFCGGGVFLRFRDGMWGAGVYAEAKFFTDRNLPIWIVDVKGKVRKGSLKRAKVLSIEETIERIRDKEGNPKPY